MDRARRQPSLRRQVPPQTSVVALGETMCALYRCTCVLLSEPNDMSFGFPHSG